MTAPMFQWCRSLGVLSTVLIVSASIAAEPAIELQTPIAGWRPPPEQGAAFTQQVNYPASSVNSAADQADAARIRGRVTTAVKGAARLQVNGLSMPLRIEDDGGFDRPYAFPSGSNGVEVRADTNAGELVRRVQFYQTPGAGSAAKLRVVLAWDSDHTDLDLHVITPDGQHAWYGGRVLSNGGALDVDVTTGYGPEIFATPTPLPGRYLVYVNYYGGGYGGDDPVQILTTARISILSEEGSINEKLRSIDVPMRAAGELTLVAAFSYP